MPLIWLTLIIYCFPLKNLIISLRRVMDDEVLTLPKLSIAHNIIYPNNIRISTPLVELRNHNHFLLLLSINHPTAFNLTYILITYMHIYFCCLRTFVPQQFLDIPKVCTTFQYMCGKTMSERVTRGFLFNVSIFTGI